MTAEPRSDVDAAKAAICEEPADLFSPGAREVLARAAAAYLVPQYLTPIEVLHAIDYQEKFANAGTHAMQTVQKTSSWQVRGLNVPVSERIRRLWEISDEVRKLVRERLEAEPAQPITPDTLPDVIARRDGESDADLAFRVFVGLTATLRDRENWVSKFSAVAGLGSAIATLDAFTYFDQLIAELLRAPAALDAVLGRQDTMGDDTLRLLALAGGTAKPETAPAEPPTARALFELCAKARMPHTAEVLEAHAIRLVCSSDKFTRRPLMDEIAFVVDLRERMTRDGELIGGATTQEALERRLARALSDQTIDFLMEGTNSVGERVLRAVQLHSKIFGEAAKRYLETYAAELMGQPNLAGKVAPEGASLHQRIKLLGKLHAALVTADMAEKTRERLANQVEGMQTELLDQSGMLEKIGTAKGPTGERLVKLVDLCREGAFIDGPNAARARQAAQKLMKKPDFLDSYLDGATEKGARAARLKELQKMLAEARIV
ncbi:MAG: hypothetical protein HQ481_05945 [Alphaproteobacteria bacterium]|nr:hypothetical protein [Alphaproteobacteria bacterium]